MSEEFVESIARRLDPDAWQTADVLLVKKEARERLLRDSMTKARALLPLIDERLQEASQSAAVEKEDVAARIAKEILGDSIAYHGMPVAEVTETVAYILKHAETKSLTSLIGAGLSLDLGFADLCADVAPYVLAAKMAEEMNRP